MEDNNFSRLGEDEPSLLATHPEDDTCEDDDTEYPEKCHKYFADWATQLESWNIDTGPAANLESSSEKGGDEVVDAAPDDDAGELRQPPPIVYRTRCECVNYKERSDFGKVTLKDWFMLDDDDTAPPNKIYVTHGSTVTAYAKLPRSRVWRLGEERAAYSRMKLRIALLVTMLLVTVFAILMPY